MTSETVPTRLPLSRFDSSRPYASAVAVALAVTVAGCGSGLKPRIELQATPVAIYDAPSGKTTLFLDFLVRDASGRSVDLSKASLRRLVNGQPVDIESVPDFKDTKLASNLTLGMVLDASYSMTTWNPPAFGPMKQAALDSQQSIRLQFAAWNSGTFRSTTSWFQDQYVCAPSSPTMSDSAVLDIPDPKPGDSTKLFAAAAQLVDHMRALYDASPSHTSADHWALVVFTDGADNYSWHDDSTAAAKTYPASGGAYACAGPPAVSLPDLLGKMKAFPELKVHVIGLGNAIKAPELSAIATGGGGRFVSNPDTRQVSSLFSEITREFTSIRRDGVKMPLPPGDYEYVEEAEVDGASATVRFRFHAGDAQTRVDAASITAG